jgi:hypothetical protein
MKRPEIDRSNLPLWKAQMEKIRADAESEVERRMQSMSATERTKFNRFLNNIRFLGDVGKAAARSRVNRTLLDRWMNTPGLSWKINMAFNEAQAIAHGGDTADDVLWRAKVAPELEKDAECFRKDGQRYRKSRVIAKLAARDLKAYRWHIAQAANNNDKYFFIDLAKCLTGDIATDFYDKLDRDIAEICCSDRTITAPAAVAELKRRGHDSVNEEQFRMRKKRLGLAKPKGLQSVTNLPK